LSKSYMNLDVTYNYAIEKFAAKEPALMAENAGVPYDSGSSLFTVRYLGDDYHISFPDGAVKYVAKDDEVSITVKILILHYLVTANGAPMQGKLISFKELPDGAIYINPFTNRAIRPMINLFADKQEKFVELARAVGGEVAAYGDTSVTIPVLPRAPITYVIWSGDEEFPASGNVLFDASAPNYLPTEDYALVSGLVIYYLGGLLPKK